MKTFKIFSMALVASVGIVQGQDVNLAKKAIDAEQYEKAKTMLKSMIQAKPENGKATFLLGTIYLKQNKYPEALKNYFDALKLAEEIGDKLMISTSYNFIGEVYSNQGNYPEAIKNFSRAKDLFEVQKDKKGMAVIYGNIGHILMIMHLKEQKPLSIQ